MKNNENNITINIGDIKRVYIGDENREVLWSRNEDGQFEAFHRSHSKDEVVCNCCGELKHKCECKGYIRIREEGGNIMSEEDMINMIQSVYERSSEYELSLIINNKSGSSINLL